MSRQQSAGIGGGRRYGRSVAMTIALVAGIAACGGDDDDAADSTTAPATTGVEATAAETTVPAEITAAHDTTGTEPSDTSTDGTTAATAAEGSEPEGAGSDTTEQPDGAAVVAASEDSEAGDATDTTADGETDGTALDVGPTTTGPACEFEENSSLPLERCNMGPAVAVVQSILQANGFAVDTIDGNFGDQTLYAVRAFQEDEGLEVDGIVGLQTWSALDVSQFGTDEDGDGVIEPDEIDLSE